MCKLCNTDNKSVKRSKYKELIEIIKEYIGEYPCQKCITAYRLNIYKGYNKPIDEWIMYRLHRKYYCEQILNYRKARRKDSTLKEAVMAGVLKITNLLTSYIYYEVSMKVQNKDIVFPSYKTAEEAVIAKITYLYEHGLQDSAQMKNITTQLKGLQNV